MTAHRSIDDCKDDRVKATAQWRQEVAQLSDIELAVMVQQHLREAEARGGTDRVVAALDRAVAAAHHRSQATSITCHGCAEPWPCSWIRQIVARVR